MAREADNSREVVQEWLDGFVAALATADPERVAALFVAESYWRDLVSFTWDIRFLSGAGEIGRGLVESDARERSANWRISSRLPQPRAVQRVGRDVVEAFLEFDTGFGRGTAIVRLSADDGGAWVLMTALTDVHGSSRLYDSARPAGAGFDRSLGKTWSDIRREAQDYTGRDPDVLIVGGGHSGLFVAAHLNRLGVDALVVDKHPRIGDNWRRRYETLVLHNKTDMVQFPYLPLPDVFPEYLTKDRFASWFEPFVEAMDINYWTSTTFVGGTYDDATGRWEARLDRDGAPVELRPRHVVIATGGVGGTPNVPALPGIESFGGSVLHVKDFTSGADYGPQKVLVVGVGSSAHDVANDLEANGADVTMLQRTPASVVDLDTANMWYPQYGDGTPTEEADLLASAGFIEPLFRQSMRLLAGKTSGFDDELHAGLRAAGLMIDETDAREGWLRRFYERAGGYYINVGTSQKIIDGSIKILQTADVDTFDDTGLRLHDGSRRDFDAVVLATGYLNQQSELRRYFGDEVADAVGPVWGFDEDGEMRNAWRPTRQPGLWLMVSAISHARTHAPLVALQIRGDLDGAARVPDRLREPAGEPLPQGVGG